MGRVWPVLGVVAVFGAIGLAGVLKPSRGESADAADVQARLDAVPMTLADPAGGSWVAAANPIPDKYLAVAEAQAYLSRTYTHSGQLGAVALLLLYGEPGPLGAHTPETCYAGAGYDQHGAATRRDLAGGVFWTAPFQKPDAGPRLNVNWAWGDGTGWRASDNARFDFAASGRVYKLYASYLQPAARGGTGATPVDRLLPLFLAELRPRLASPPADIGVPK
jgi:hypothetical protein